MKVLNLYAGIGGNRKLWTDVEVTAVEIVPEIAKICQDFFPQDKVIVADAHQYLLEHFKEFEFIWSSPPCSSHSQFRQRCGVRAWGYEPMYPDMKLYEEIIFLQYHCKNKFVVENVIPYYPPLIKAQIIARHCFWSNFLISPFRRQPIKIKASEAKDLAKIYGYDLSKCRMKNIRQTLRNCVEPELGLHILNESKRNIQAELFTPPAK